MANTTVNFSKRVRDVLNENFSGAQVSVEDYDGEERVGGYILWDGFDDQEAIDRQLAIFKVLRDKLGAEAQRVSLIFAYTPREWEIMSAA